jgi:hypothetical protein
MPSHSASATEGEIMPLVKAKRPDLPTAGRDVAGPGIEVAGLNALKHSAPWIDLNSAQTPLYNHDMTGQGWAQLLVAAAIWLGLPLVLGTIRVRRGEVKSA